MDYQDVLAHVGAGSAHPGGMVSSALWMRAVDIRPEHAVLEVGCGTGRTSVTLASQCLCQVTGIDVRKAMIEKAHRRAELARATARFQVASAEKLPFADASFDWLVTESVTVFCDAPRVLSEFARVLKPGGYYVDVEMLVLEPVTATWRDAAKQAYGIVHVPDLAGWKRWYRDNGFCATQVLCMKRVKPTDALLSDEQYPDPYDLTSAGAYQHPDVVRVLQQNATWLEQHHRSLGYAIFLNHRQGSDA